MPTPYRCGLSVREVVKWDRRELTRSLRWIVKDDGSMFGDVDELLDHLMDLVSHGIDHIPSTYCDNCDPALGCLGHTRPSQRTKP